MRRTLALLLATTALTLCCAAPAIAQAPAGSTDAAAQPDRATPDPVIDEEAIVAPRTVVEGTEQAPAQAPAQEPPQEQQPAQEQGQEQPPAAQPRIAVGNAAFQRTPVKRAEARRACVAAKRPPTSPMLGASSAVVIDEQRNWGLLLLVPAAGVALFALVLAIRRRRSPRDARADDPLARIATLVAITGGLVGVVLQFAPGVAVAERPAREAQMKVREVHPRVTRGEYAEKVGASIHLSTIDRREVGNVIWLELNLRGYEGATPVLQYGLYDEGRGEVLLPNTAKQTRLARQRGDEQTSFVPIWVGYPTTNKFRAQFRLLDRGRVQEMARTGKMRGSAYRYGCTRA